MSDDLRHALPFSGSDGPPGAHKGPQCFSMKNLMSHGLNKLWVSRALLASFFKEYCTTTTYTGYTVLVRVIMERFTHKPMEFHNWFQLIKCIL